MKEDTDAPSGDRRLRRQRDVLLEALCRCRDAVAARGPADAALARFTTEHRELGSRDRRFLSDTIFAVFRWQGWLREFEAGNPATLAALACQLDGQEVHPALAADLPADAESVIARLRAQPVALLAPAWLGPFLAAELREETGADAFLLSLQQRPPTWLRARRGQAKRVAAHITGMGFTASIHPHVRDAIAVPPRIPWNEIKRALGHDVEIHDLASQVVALAAGPRPGESWWDACAGSGGKTLHLADLLSGRGSILATDVRESIMRELNRRTSEIDSVKVRIGRLNAENESPNDEQFQGALVDAPCSGTGTWSRNPDARWRCTAEFVDECSKRQGRILHNASRHVAPGGLLTYAVCSVTQAETHAIADAFLLSHPTFEPAPFPNPLQPESTPSRLLVRPADGPGDGMFIARFRRANKTV